MRRNEESEFIKKQQEGKDGKSMWKDFYNSKMKFFNSEDCKIVIKKSNLG